MKNSRIAVVVLSLLLMSVMAFSLVFYECDDSDCDHHCSIQCGAGCTCEETNDCCGYCTEDGGHTKDWCCLACGFPKI